MSLTWIECFELWRNTLWMKNFPNVNKKDSVQSIHALHTIKFYLIYNLSNIRNELYSNNRSIKMIEVWNNQKFNSNS